MSDLYYTDFALRTLAWLAPGHAAFARAADYLAAVPFPPRDMVACFNLLNARRLCSGKRSNVPIARRGRRARSRWPSGSSRNCFPAAVLPVGRRPSASSAYHTFLGALCFQMLRPKCPWARRRLRPWRP